MRVRVAVVHAARLATAAALIAGCKTDPQRASSSTTAAPAPTPRPATARDADTGADDPAGAPVFELARLRELAPTLDDATALQPLRVMAERELAHQSWCVAGSDAQATARAIATTITRQGWDDAEVRGTARRAAVSAHRDQVRLSISVGGRDQACDGLVATAQYASSTVTLPPLEDGERIR